MGRGEGPALTALARLRSRPQAWWPLATLTRRDGRLDSSPWSVVRLLWLTDRCSWARTKEQRLSGVGVSMESLPATALHIQGTLGHLYSVPNHRPSLFLHASRGEVLPPPCQLCLQPSAASCHLPSVQALSTWSRPTHGHPPCPLRPLTSFCRAANSSGR